MRCIRLPHVLAELPALGAWIIASCAPARTTAPLKLTAVSAGGEHTCGLTAEGAAYCWGMNANGQLGNGTAGPWSTPMPVAGGLSFVAVSAGGAHSCALTATGAAYCWGENDQGELGDGTTTQRAAPVPVAGGVQFASVDAGDDHTCGVTAEGAGDCWGGNGGELGDGTMTDRSRPVLVSGSLRFAGVSAGRDHTCGVTTAGAAYCWGYNFMGRLGNDAPGPEFCTPDNRACSTVPVRVTGSISFAGVSAGAQHTCGVTTTGAAYCWGDRLRPDGTMTKESRPTLVAGGLTFAPVSAGGDARHTCGVTTEGAAYCWGLGVFGELGDATRTRRQPSPVLVAGALRFTAVSAGNNHTCGVTVEGAAYCWGRNAGGQLGDGTTTDRLSPVVVVQ